MPSVTSTVLAALLSASGALAQTGDVFVVNCDNLSKQRSDPIVSPGVASGHVHNIVGGTAFNRTMTIDQATKSKNTTCTKILDKSNYWIPQLYHIRSDGKFELVPTTGTAAYYLNRQCDYDGTADNCNKNGQDYAAAPPAGLRMFAGDPALRTFNSSDKRQLAISHHCLPLSGQSQNDKEYNSLPPTLCDRIRAQVTFPSCWDGVNLDTANHKDHMTYPVQNYNGGRCPSTHPKAIIQIFTEFFYETRTFSDNNFVYAMGDKTGYGLHGDFINGWTNQTALGLMHKTCTGPNYSPDSPGCSINVPGNNNGVSYSPEVPAPYEEEIGLNGPITKLPGNNTVSGNTPTQKKRSRIYGASEIM